MRKSSISIYDDIVIDKILKTSSNRKAIEEWIDNIKKGNKKDYDSLVNLLQIMGEHPELEAFLTKELLAIYKDVLTATGHTEETFQKQIQRLEDL